MTPKRKLQLARDQIRYDMLSLIEDDQDYEEKRLMLYVYLSAINDVILKQKYGNDTACKTTAAQYLLAEKQEHLEMMGINPRWMKDKLEKYGLLDEIKKHA